MGNMHTGIRNCMGSLIINVMCIVCVHVYVCVFVCLCVLICVRVLGATWVCGHACRCVWCVFMSHMCMCVCVCVCVCRGVFVDTHTLHGGVSRVICKNNV